MALRRPYTWDSQPGESPCPPRGPLARSGGRRLCTDEPADEPPPQDARDEAKQGWAVCNHGCNLARPIAGPEQFKARDIADTLWQLPLIWFGAYGGAPFRWNWFALIPLALTVGVVAVGAVAVWRRLSRKRSG